MIQVRDVPAELHRELEARAARAGRSLSDYLLRELARVVGRPTPEEMRRRLEGRAAVELREPVAQAVRAERDAR